MYSICFFVFKQKMAYEMRISDWSSDVCSSDLSELQLIANKQHFAAPNIDEIVMVVVPSVAGILGRLQAGEIDFTDGINLKPSQAASLAGVSHVKVEKVRDENWLPGVPRAAQVPFRDYTFLRGWHPWIRTQER